MFSSAKICGLLFNHIYWELDCRLFQPKSQTMFSRNGLFILIAIFFLFTYPFTLRTWNLNESIGWHTTVGRPWSTFLLPLWFLLIYFTYQRTAAKGIIINSSFFWIHILLTIIPTFFINYPFIKTVQSFNQITANPGETLFRINFRVTLFLVVQVLMYSFLLYKLFRKTST